jgi:hypothetical protein
MGYFYFLMSIFRNVERRRPRLRMCFVFPIPAITRDVGDPGDLPPRYPN